MFSKAIEKVNAFGKERRGNIAIMFGFLAVPLVGAVGLAIDFSLSSHANSRLAEAVDAAGLAAARARLDDSDLTVAEAKIIARKAFNANARDIPQVTIEDFDLTHDPANDVYTASVDGFINTNFSRVLGFKSVDVEIEADITVAPPRKLEAMLVLDNTGSMEGAKLTALKDAAGNLVNNLMTENGNAEIGIVPFANYVNVGVSRRSERWLDVPPDESETENVCRTTYPNRQRSNCTTIRTTCSRTRDGVTRSWPCTRRSCDVDDGEPEEVCEDETRESSWNGCVGSRNAPYDVRDGGFDLRRVPGLLDVECGEEVLPLTQSKTAVEQRLEDMEARGFTYIPAGLSWGLRLISNGIPFTEGDTYDETRDEQGLKAIVLMTDGENTKSARYPEHDRNNTGEANRRTRDLCNEIKTQPIVIYTIAFEVTDNTTKSLLEDCASEPSNYFDADNASALFSAFDDISNSLKELALSR